MKPLSELRKLADGFRGRFVFDPAHTEDRGIGTIADFVEIGDRLMYVPEGADIRDDECHCISDQLDEHVAVALAEMLNAFPELLDKIQELQK